MKTRILIIMIAVGSLFASGCGFIFVARSRPYTPGYCYDCHRPNIWHRVYTNCDHYDIVVVDGGYKYRPHHHKKHDEYKVAKYDHAREKQERQKKQQKEEREKKEGKSRDKKEDKDKRSRR